MLKNIHVSPEENKRLISLCNSEIDYTFINTASSNEKLLFCHGSEEGYVYLNNNPYTFEDIGKSLPDNINSLKVICCHSSYMTSYNNGTTNVVPYVNTPDCINLHTTDNASYCSITY